MPTNLPPEYSEAKEKYEEANSTQEKIKYTEEMISRCPKHKGAQNLLKNLKKRLKKLREKQEKQKEVKSSGQSLAVEKEGFQVCIVGYPNTGKSTLLKKLTNADPEIANYPYTTKEPEVGILNYQGGKIQLVDLPPIKEEPTEKQGEIMSIIKNTDGLILMLGRNPEKEKKTMKRKIERTDEEIPTLTVKKGKIPEKEEIFNFFNLIRVYTKKPGKKPDKENPLVLKKSSTVKEAGEEIHKDFTKKLKYARVWGSSKFDGQRVEKSHVLEDEDVVEFHTE